ncbi:broad-complex core protein isoforms 1/2/3/4/5-like [Penaeus monodon]|uniref:broad-complex core protein isoforms 1/2/3/4/5-like n=1 Tax=Penaeus monodon TaxID=6687 RepID=UPI000F6728EB|nr:broad-complex core protein isoforms 1/2/3/4/5-like [Penaeus vannamei]XP_037798974.1 broad-complex core protein isoforms 1/2/3/4/5-like [Penaeus monodon]
MMVIMIFVVSCGTRYGEARSCTALTPHFVAGGWYGRRQCDVCGKSLSSKYALQVHMRDVHTEVRRTFTCSLCNKVYASQNSYRVHMSIKHRQQQSPQVPTLPPSPHQGPL